MAIDSYRKKNVEKVVETPRTIQDQRTNIENLKSLLDSLPQLEEKPTSDIDIEYVKKEEKDEGITPSIPSINSQTFINNFVSSENNNSVLKSDNSDLIMAQAKVNRLRADIQDMFINTKGLSAEQITDIRRQLDDITSLPSDNLEDLNSKIEYLSSLKQKTNLIVEEKKKSINLNEKYRKFLEDIKNKYGINYIVKMTNQEQNEYISMYSSIYQVSPEEVRNSIDKQINDAYEKKVNTNTNSNNSDLIMAQAKVNRLRADIQDMFINTKGLSAEQITDIRRQLDDIISLPSDNLEDLNSKIEYLTSLKQRIALPKNETRPLEELMPVLQEEGYTIFGHGTGGNNKEAINSIFTNGLRASHTSVFYTTIGLDVGKDISSFKEKLDHWQHLDSENIILMKLPNEFFNMIGDSSDLECERTAAFVNKITDDRGNSTYYLDSKFILGAYNRNSGQIELNPNFESKLSVATMKEMEEKLKIAIAKVKKRNNSFAQQIEGLNPITENVEEQKRSIPQLDMNSTFDDLNWDDEFPPLEEEYKGIKR